MRNGSFFLRLANPDDISPIGELMAVSIAELQKGFLSAAEIEAALNAARWLPARGNPLETGDRASALSIELTFREYQPGAWKAPSRRE